MQRCELQPFAPGVPGARCRLTPRPSDIPGLSRHALRLAIATASLYTSRRLRLPRCWLRHTHPRGHPPDHRRACLRHPRAGLPHGDAPSPRPSSANSTRAPGRASSPPATPTLRCYGTILTQTSVPLTYDATSGVTSSYLITLTARVTLTATRRPLFSTATIRSPSASSTSPRGDLTGFIREDTPAVQRLANNFAHAVVSDMLESFLDECPHQCSRLIHAAGGPSFAASSRRVELF